jgi:radical SAM protein with 4Fe4S-binding SPASM domain
MLHVRPTRKCNADCAYCCSWQPDAQAAGGSRDTELTPEVYTTALSFIWVLWERYDLVPEKVEASYLGGEVLTLPHERLKAVVDTARDFFAERGVEFVDSVQTNMIGTYEQVTRLFGLFEWRAGTTIDRMGNLRTVNGCASEYRSIFRVNDIKLRMGRKQRDPIPAVFVLDAMGIKHLPDEMSAAKREGRDLMLRTPLFGFRDVSAPAPKTIGEALVEAFDSWYLRSNYVLEPMFTLLQRRLAARGALPPMPAPGCPFRTHCGERVVNIDPDGKLYLCQEQADVGMPAFANPVNGDFDEALWLRLRDREVPDDCIECPWVADCQGGCMTEAILHGNDEHGPTGLCEAWKMLFVRIEESLRSRDRYAVEWIKRLSARDDRRRHARRVA